MEEPHEFSERIKQSFLKDESRRYKDFIKNRKHDSIIENYGAFLWKYLRVYYKIYGKYPDEIPQNYEEYFIPYVEYCEPSNPMLPSYFRESIKYYPLIKSVYYKGG
jgi:hypothetical protein